MTTAGCLLTGRDIDTGLLGERLGGYLPLLLVWSFFAAGEEPGWRGLALPRLQRSVTPVGATVVLGTRWAIWHLPLLAAADEPSHGLSAFALVAVIAATVLAIIGYSFFYTYLYNRTRSIWLAIVLHGSVTAASGSFILVASDDQRGGAYAVLQATTTVVVLTAAILLVRLTHGRLGLTPDTTARSRRDYRRSSLRVTDPTSEASR